MLYIYIHIPHNPVYLFIFLTDKGNKHLLVSIMYVNASNTPVKELADMS